MNINSRKAEFVGIYLGDGYLYEKEGKRQIGFVGSPRTDVELFKNLRKLIKKEWNKDVKLKLELKV